MPALKQSQMEITTLINPKKYVFIFLFQENTALIIPVKTAVNSSGFKKTSHIVNSPANGI